MNRQSFPLLSPCKLTASFDAHTSEEVPTSVLPVETLASYLVAPYEALAEPPRRSLLTLERPLTSSALCLDAKPGFVFFPLFLGMDKLTSGLTNMVRTMANMTRTAAAAKIALGNKATVLLYITPNTMG